LAAFPHVGTLISPDSSPNTVSYFRNKLAASTGEAFKTESNPESSVRMVVFQRAQDWATKAFPVLPALYAFMQTHDHVFIISAEIGVKRDLEGDWDFPNILVNSTSDTPSQIFQVTKPVVDWLNIPLQV